MQNDLLTLAEQYQKKHKRRNVWQRIVGSLACMVVFCTTYALILPAITMEETVYCGMEEHYHTEECFENQLVCGGYDESQDNDLESSESGDAYSEEYYKEQKVLVCGQEESAGHIHEESCISRERMLVCTEEHEHTDSCCETAENYICGMAEGEGSHIHSYECYETQETPETTEISADIQESHGHTDDCYKYVPVCQKEEHEHTFACYSNPEADLESASIWERSISNVELTGIWADDVIAVAESQLGYHESIKNYQVTETGKPAKGITRYGQWYGDPYGDWCAMFVSFCLHYADISETAIPYDKDCQYWIEILSNPEWDIYRESDFYTPVKGDIIFFDNDDDGCADHAGLVRNLNEKNLTVIEGNSADCVQSNEYQVDDTRIIGYGVLPKNDAYPPNEEKPAVQVHTLTATLYTDNTYQVLSGDATEITVTGEIPEDAEALAFPVMVETEMQVLCAYDIAIRLPDGSLFEPSEDTLVMVSIQSSGFAVMDEGLEAEVYYVPVSGEPERMESVRTDSEVRFEASRLSAYMVISALSSGAPDLPVQTLTAAIYTDGTYQNLSDDVTEIRVTGKLPEDAEALAFPVTVETEMQVLCAYDIAIRLPDGSLFESDMDTPVTISMQSPNFSEIDEKMKTEVYLVPVTGEPERVKSGIIGNEIQFEVNCISTYMVVEVSENLNAEEQETIALSEDFLYENEQFSITFHVEGGARLQSGEEAAVSEPSDDLQPYSEITSETNSPQDMMNELDTNLQQNAAETPAENEATEKDPTEKEAPVLVVTELSEAQMEYQQIISAFDEGYTDGLIDLSVLSLKFYRQDALLDVSSCSITAQITPQLQMMETAQAVCAELQADAAPDAETGVVFAVVEATNEGAEESDSVMVNTSTQEAPILTASVGSNGILAVTASKTANPKFTVQYYAWLDVVADSGDATDNLPIIDTSGVGLPTNGSTPKIKTLYLEEMGSSGVYGIKTTSTLTQIYNDYEYQYITAPNLTYFNRLYENGHYNIKEIWILKDGKDGKSVNRDDWDVYSPAGTHFTNRSQSVNDNVVYINDGTVIRLVFDTTESIYTNAVNFYDYDITDDGVHTNKQGINSASNYTGSGAKLAFGNSNTDTGLADVIWEGNTLNKANSSGYSGCTFGLVDSYSNEKIQYASGVNAPNLFNDGNATGKTSYDNGQYTLSFNRSGDTYTLSSVGGTNSATGLQNFTSRPNWNNTRKIWSNHFWPVDNVKNKDPHTGASGNPGTYIGASGKTEKYPTSDNGIAHNNMFAMTYQVQFTITEDYIGPLEYYFFGDDDMWVFLDDTLVCDIGGVHSSVGEYVDLWDYIKKGSSGTHTLSFFYTERGLSGSTCYMQFTLPAISSITPEQNTGLLTVQKLVEGAVDSDEEFHFEIMLTDENGETLLDDYSYTRYTADGEIVKQDIIIYDGASFDLKAGEYAIINYLPYGTRYTVTETDVPYYKVSYRVDDGTSVEGYTAAGQIPTGGNGSVVFTNTAMPVLPSTGGSGTKMYTIGGVLLTTAAIFMLYRNKKRGIVSS